MSKDINDIAFRKRVEQVLLAPVLLCTLFLLPFLIFKQITQGLKSTAWPKAPGRVISSEVVMKYTKEEAELEDQAPTDEANKPKVAPSYRPVVYFEYWVKGRRFESDNLAYIQDGSGQSWAEGKIEKYTPGKRVIVRYDPLDPENAVLEAGASQEGILSTTMSFLIFELLLTFICAVFLWDIYRLNFLIIHKKLDSAGKTNPNEEETDLKTKKRKRA